jgi:hypothetical protein
VFYGLHIPSTNGIPLPYSLLRKKNPANYKV